MVIRFKKSKSLFFTSYQQTAKLNGKAEIHLTVSFSDFCSKNAISKNEISERVWISFFWII